MIRKIKLTQRRVIRVARGFINLNRCTRSTSMRTAITTQLSQRNAFLRVDLFFEAEMYARTHISDIAPLIEEPRALDLPEIARQSGQSQRCSRKIGVQSLIKRVIKRAMSLGQALICRCVAIRPDTVPIRRSLINYRTDSNLHHRKY